MWLMNKIDISIVKLSHLEKVVKNLRRQSGTKDIDVSFEYICSSCFPTVWNNVQETLKDEHMKGFLEAKELYDRNK